MIKILKAWEEHLDAAGNEREPTVIVEIEIDGKRTGVGRIDPKWDKAQVLNYLENKRDEILANIAANEVDDTSRPDLITEVSRNLAAEIDDLKSTVAKLEKK